MKGRILPDRRLHPGPQEEPKTGSERLEKWDFFYFSLLSILHSVFRIPEFRYV